MLAMLVGGLGESPITSIFGSARSVQLLAVIGVSANIHLVRFFLPASRSAFARPPLWPSAAFARSTLVNKLHSPLMKLIGFFIYPLVVVYHIGLKW
jgi:hypothetical protein